MLLETNFWNWFYILMRTIYLIDLIKVMFYPIRWPVVINASILYGSFSLIIFLLSHLEFQNAPMWRTILEHSRPQTAAIIWAIWELALDSTKAAPSFIAGIKGTDSIQNSNHFDFQNQTKTDICLQTTTKSSYTNLTSTINPIFLGLSSNENYYLLFSGYARRNNIS